jgi:hypothetical protein
MSSAFGEEIAGTGMNLEEPELVSEAIDGIADVFARHPGGVFDPAALTRLDHHAYTVRIRTTDETCREKLGDIQDRAAVYFSGRGCEAYRRGQMSGAEVVRREIDAAVSALRARFREMQSEAA